MEKNEKLELDNLDQVTGGVVVEDGGKFWLIRQDGTVIAPAPSREKAQECARTMNISPDILTKEEYKAHFGRELKW